LKALGHHTWILSFVAVCFHFTNSALADLKAFPLSAGQRGTVACLENPSVSYDIYLPPAYSTNGTPLPILYTLNSGGGGMVSSFQTVCSSLNIICVGILNSKNSAPWNPVLRDFYEVPRDIRQRVLFDPTAVFVGGLSGGGENSYVFSRVWSQHVCGVLAMGGWLGRQNVSSTNVPYFSTDRVQTNLLVARTTGTSDTSAIFYNSFDTNYLASCGAVVKDWSFSGGHVTAPDSVKTACLQWLLSQRIPAGANDQSSSFVQAADWRSRAAVGQSGAVLRECVSTLANQPRTWFALQAQLVMDDLMTNYNTFRWLSVSNLYPASGAWVTNIYVVTNGNVRDYVNKITIVGFVGVNAWSQSDFVCDLFYYYARGAATNGDWQRYQCALKILTGIVGVNGDRAGDMAYILTNFNYTAPLVQITASRTSNQLSLSLSKDAPGLAYSVQSRTNLFSDVWQNTSPNTADAATLWSATLNFDPESESAFFRIRTTPLSGMSPPWPDDGGTGQ
jgi:hypothetical protein